jgi:hypothetical protein
MYVVCCAGGFFPAHWIRRKILPLGCRVAEWALVRRAQFGGTTSTVDICKSSFFLSCKMAVEEKNRKHSKNLAEADHKHPPTHAQTRATFAAPMDCDVKIKCNKYLGMKEVKDHHDIASPPNPPPLI